ncbi:MAG: DUF4221 domain-containing protein [Tannerella sp.]|jgi:hypothetical protein|nr:DUF4221 domain-containing protein [Tannerella sp.]
MKKIQLITAAFLLLGTVNSCYTRSDSVLHKGENKTKNRSIIIDWDSTEVDIFYTGGQGNFFMKDSIITFASHYYAKIYDYDCNSIELISSHFGLGQGPNELLRFFHATPIINDTSFFIINNNIDVTLYNNRYELERKGIIDFKWKGLRIGAYDSPSVYNFMLKTDLGANIYKYGENLIIPLQPVLHYVCEDERVTKEHFAKSHIFGLLDINTMEVNTVFGHYPPVYRKQLLPHFNFFSYTFDNDLFYVDFPVDSLIYVYKYPDTLLYSFGFECKDIVRSYTTSTVLNDEIYEDFRRNGLNAEIVNFKESGLLFRTYIRNMEKATCGMQIYDSTTYDLLADMDVPFSFKLLGSCGGCFYGVTMMPRETDDNTYVTFYKLKITL